MSQSKIEFRLGAIHFIGEGEKVWVTKQLDKMIAQAPSLLRVTSGITGDMEEYTNDTSDNSPKRRGRKPGRKISSSKAVPAVSPVKSTTAGKSLAAFIQSKNAGSNQRLKFLATAKWLSKNGKKSFVTRDVTKAIKEARLPQLINPSQYMGQNLKQGYFKKSGKEFVMSAKGNTVL